MTVVKSHSVGICVQESCEATFSWYLCRVVESHSLGICVQDSCTFLFCWFLCTGHLYSHIVLVFVYRTVVQSHSVGICL
jgi:hypothetical protein